MEDQQIKEEANVLLQTPGKNKGLYEIDHSETQLRKMKTPKQSLKTRQLESKIHDALSELSYLRGEEDKWKTKFQHQDEFIKKCQEIIRSYESAVFQPKSIQQDIQNNNQFEHQQLQHQHKSVIIQSSRPFQEHKIQSRSTIQHQSPINLNFLSSNIQQHNSQSSLVNSKNILNYHQPISQNIDSLSELVNSNVSLSSIGQKRDLFKENQYVQFFSGARLVRSDHKKPNDSLLNIDITKSTQWDPYSNNTSINNSQHNQRITKSNDASSSLNIKKRPKCIPGYNYLDKQYQEQQVQNNYIRDEQMINEDQSDQGNIFRNPELKFYLGQNKRRESLKQQFRIQSTPNLSLIKMSTDKLQKISSREIKRRLQKIELPKFPS